MLPSQFIIISLDTRDREAVQSEIDAMVALFDAQVVTGSYKGHQEVSFLVDYLYLDSMLDLASKFKQESILVRDGINISLLYVESLDNTVIGNELVDVGLGEPSVDAWTKIGNNYFVVS